MFSYVLGREKLKSVARIEVFNQIQNVHKFLIFHSYQKLKKCIKQCFLKNSAENFTTTRFYVQFLLKTISMVNYQNFEMYIDYWELLRFVNNSTVKNNS